MTDGNEGVAGLTKREYFAAMAMQGYIAPYIAEDVNGNKAELVGHDEKNIALQAVALADALIAALNPEPKQNAEART